MGPRAIASNSAGSGGSVFPGAGASGTRVGSPCEGLASSSTMFSTSGEGGPGGTATAAGGATIRYMGLLGKVTMLNCAPPLPLLADAISSRFFIRAVAYCTRILSAGREWADMAGMFTAGSGVAVSMQLTEST